MAVTNETETAGAFQEPETPADLPSLAGETFPRWRGTDHQEPESIPLGPAFVLSRRIARGGNGEVWEGRQTVLDRLVAIKILRADVIRNEELLTDPSAEVSARTLLRGEALIAARLDHPNIVPVYDMYLDEGGLPRLAMKLVDGTPWNELIARGLQRPLPEFLEEHLAILTQVCQAVAFAHSRGVVHRDLKPSQVVVGNFGEVFLMDWGLAIHVPELTPGEVPPAYLPTPETAHNPAGTPAFMAPEQTLPNARNVSARTDIYLLGAILYNLLAGVPPHDAPTSQAAFFHAFRGEVTPPRRLAPERAIPPELESLCLRALSPLPGDRPDSVQDFLTAIRDYLRGANRRREAQERVAQARAMLAGSPDYHGYGEILRKLEDARLLWNDCPGVREQHGQAIERFARSAMRNGDLVLARTQMARLEDDAAARSLGAELDAAELSHSRAEKQRRIATLASMLLLAGVGILGVLLNVNQRRANAQLLERQRQLELAHERAESARRDAEGIMTFMLDYLRERLVPIGQLALLEEVAGRAEQYYENLPVVDSSLESLHNRINLLVQLSGIQQSLGNRHEALRTMEQAVKLSRGYPQLRQSLAGSLDAIGTILIELARYEESLRRFDESLEVLESIPPETPRVMIPERDIGVAHLHKARALRFLDRHAEARKALDRGEENLLAALEKASDEQASLILVDLMVYYDQSGSLEESRGEFARARAQYRRGMEILDKQVQADPDNWAYRRSRAIYLSKIGDMVFAENDPKAARGFYLQALEQTAEMVARDPKNADWTYVHGWQMKRLNWAEEQLGDFEKALEHARQMRELFGGLYAVNPSNHVYQGELAKACDSVGYDLAHLGRYEEATAAFMDAAQYHILPGDGASGEYASPLADHAFWTARCFAMMGDGDASRSYLGRHEQMLGGQDGREFTVAVQWLKARRPVIELLLGDGAAACRLLQEGWDAGYLTMDVLRGEDFGPVRESKEPCIVEFFAGIEW